MEPHFARDVLGQRVGDVERSSTCDQLAAQFAAGRINGDELDERLGRAVAAQTAADLQSLVRDLPPLPQRGPTFDPPRHRRPQNSGSILGRWTTLDVLAALSLLTCAVVIAGLLVLMVASQRFDLLAFTIVGGGAAATLGASVTHLAHRSWIRQRSRASAWPDGVRREGIEPPTR